MKAHSLTFTAPGKVELRERELATPEPGCLSIETRASLISAGTELLLYRGEAPEGMKADDVLPALSDELKYPLTYGYAAVGEVVALGRNVDPQWEGRRVFAFNPHESAFNAALHDIQALPDECGWEDAAFLANVETAINLVLDANPRIGEQVVLLGQGVLGLLTTALLARHPLKALLAFDPHPARRAVSGDMGAHLCLDLSVDETIGEARQRLGREGADVVIELSGHPSALDQALTLVGREGRVIVGSWYGTRQASLDLGGRFHRDRIQLISSHVGAIQPALRGRWDRERRFALAWQLVGELNPGRLISHRVPIAEAAQAYALLDDKKSDAIGVLLTY